MPNIISASDPKPIGFVDVSRRAQNQSSTVTYNSTTVTYNDSATLYGGADSIEGDFPKIKAIVEM